MVRRVRDAADTIRGPRTLEAKTVEKSIGRPGVEAHMQPSNQRPPSHSCTRAPIIKVRKSEGSAAGDAVTATWSAHVIPGHGIIAGP
jgi:hypothetical protein